MRIYLAACLDYNYGKLLTQSCSEHRLMSFHYIGGSSPEQIKTYLRDGQAPIPKRRRKKIVRISLISKKKRRKLVKNRN